MRLPLPHHRLPGPLRTARFTLVPQTLDHAELDYAAVMSARGHLRAWSNSDWPEDSFTLADNRADLQQHIRDAESGFAYGFTVFAPSHDAVFGSVYLNPIDHFARFYELDERARSIFSMVQLEVEYWLLPELEADRAWHIEFLLRLESWLLEGWGFVQPLFGSRPPMEPRRQIFVSAGFFPVLWVKSVDLPPRRMWFHGRWSPGLPLGS